MVNNVKNFPKIEESNLMKIFNSVNSQEKFEKQTNLH